MNQKKEPRAATKELYIGIAGLVLSSIALFQSCSAEKLARLTTKERNLDIVETIVDRCLSRIEQTFSLDGNTDAENSFLYMVSFQCANEVKDVSPAFYDRHFNGAIKDSFFLPLEDDKYKFGSSKFDAPLTRSSAKIGVLLIRGFKTDIRKERRELGALLFD
ncbi:MAG: hypothetical protein AAF553_07560 [Pseudomonadota bacterium]